MINKSKSFPKPFFSLFLELKWKSYSLLNWKFSLIIEWSYTSQIWLEWFTYSEHLIQYWPPDRITKLAVALINLMSHLFRWHQTIQSTVKLVPMDVTDFARNSSVQRQEKCAQCQQAHDSFDHSEQEVIARKCNNTQNPLIDKIGFES